MNRSDSYLLDYKCNDCGADFRADEDCDRCSRCDSTSVLTFNGVSYEYYNNPYGYDYEYDLGEISYEE